MTSTGYSQLLSCKSNDPILDFVNHPFVDTSTFHSFIPNKFLTPDLRAVDLSKVLLSNSLGLNFISCQSLFYQSSGQLFGSSALFREFINQLNLVISLCNHLEARYLIFGSPDNRKGFLDVNPTILLDRFQFINNLMLDHNLLFCIEHINPSLLACDETFCTSFLNTCAFVAHLNLSSIKVNADLAMYMLDLGISELTTSLLDSFTNQILKNLSVVSHVHASLPGLVDFNKEQRDLIEHNLAPFCHNYSIPIVYEVLPT